MFVACKKQGVTDDRYTSAFDKHHYVGYAIYLNKANASDISLLDFKPGNILQVYRALADIGGRPVSLAYRINDEQIIDIGNG